MSMKKIEDYLHLYKDVMVQVKRVNDNDYHIGRVCEITSKSNHGDWVDVWFDEVITVTSQTWETSSSNAHTFFLNYDHVKPILRPLSDMTEEEMIELIRVEHPVFSHPILNDVHLTGTAIFFGAKDEKMRHFQTFSIGMCGYTAAEFVHILSNHFDLFNLILEGLAIDKTNLTGTTTKQFL